MFPRPRSPSVRPVVLALASAFALALTGCVAPGLDANSAPTLPVPTAFAKVVDAGKDGFEPVVRVGPDGTVYVAALQYLYVSHDNGTTFQRVDAATGGLPIYASDSALSVAPGGRVYIAFDWPYAGESAVCNSGDAGRTWKCSPIVVPGATDRMWILAPNDKDAYLITGQTLDRPTFAVSHDTGSSWAITSFDPRDESQGADLAWDPVQKLIVEAASDPNGSGWGVRTWAPDGTFKGFTKIAMMTREPTIAIDAAGTWWAVACLDESKDCKLAVAKSVDQGKTWTRHAFATQHNVLLPFVAAGEAGRVALGWYESNGTSNEDPANAWRVVVAQTSDGATWTQTVLTDQPVHKGTMCRAADCLGEDRFAGDFLGLAFGPDSSLHVTWMKQTGSKGIPATQLKTADWDVVQYARTMG
jgi:hypothetical protein